MAQDLDTSKGVYITLAPYKDGALQIRLPRLAVTEAQIEAALVNYKKPYRLVPVRFVEEGGTKMGHTVIIDWEAKDSGATVKNSKRTNFELELKLEQPEPWRTFAEKLAVGMGQMESKMFTVTFPADHESAALKGRTLQVQAVVKMITRKEDKEPDTRTDDEIRAELQVKGEAGVQAKMDSLADDAIKKKLLETCKVDADKVLSSVSWAKFGEKSTLEFKWNCIKEKIASTEGMEARDVTKWLRENAQITLVDRPAAPTAGR